MDGVLVAGLLALTEAIVGVVVGRIVGVTDDSVAVTGGSVAVTGGGVAELVNTAVGDGWPAVGMAGEGEIASVDVGVGASVSGR